MGWLSPKSLYRKAKKAVKKAVNYVGNLFGLNMQPDIPDTRLDPSDLGAPRVGSGHYIPQFLSYYSEYDSSGTTKASSGHLQVPGTLVFSETDGTNNKFLYLTYVLTNNRVNMVKIMDDAFPESQRSQYLYATELFLGSLAFKTQADVGRITNGVTYERMFFNNGYINPNTQPADVTNGFTHLDTQSYPGLAVVKIRLEAPDPNANLTNPPFTGPPDYYFEVFFSSIGDEPADVLQPWISDISHLYYFQPADQIDVAFQLYMYLTDPINGAGLDPSLVDAQSFVDADESVYFFGGAGHHTGTIRLRDQSIVQNIKDILFMMQASLLFRDGKFTLKVDPNFAWYMWNTTWVKTILTRHRDYSTGGAAWGLAPARIQNIQWEIEEEDINGGISLESPKADQKYTDVIIEYVDGKNEKRIVSVSDDLKAIYNVNRVAPNNDLKVTVNSANEPRYLKEFIFMQSQYSDKIQLNLRSKFLGIEPGDLITVNFDAAQLSSAQYVVMTTDVDGDYSVAVTAKKFLGSVNRRSEVAGLLAATKNSTSFAIDDTRIYDKNILNVQASADMLYNSQVTSFLGSPYNTAPFTDFQIIENRNPYFSGGVRIQNITIRPENWEPNNTRFEISIRPIGSPDFSIFPYVGVTSTKTPTSRYDLLQLERGLPTGIDHEIKIQAYDATSGTLIKEQIKNYTPPGAAIALGATTANSIKTITKRFSTDYGNKPFGTVLADPSGIDDGELNDDNSITWDELDPTSGSISGVDLAIGRYKWLYFIDEDNIPWSHIPVNNSNYGYTSAVQEGSYVSPVLANLGTDTEFWWTAEAETTPGKYFDYANPDSWYAQNLEGTFPAFEFEMIQADTTSTYLAKTSDTGFSPGSTATPLASPGKGKYIIPTIWSVAKGGSGVQVCGLDSFDIQIHTEVITATINAVDTSALPAFTGGGVGERTVDLDTVSPSTRFGRIKSISIVSDYSETQRVTGKLAAAPIDNTNSFDIEVRNPSGTLVDAVVDITIVGFPEVKAVLDADGYPTAFVNNFTGEI